MGDEEDIGTCFCTRLTRDRRTSRKCNEDNGEEVDTKYQYKDKGNYSKGNDWNVWK